MTDQEDIVMRKSRASVVLLSAALSVTAMAAQAAVPSVPLTPARRPVTVVSTQVYNPFNIAVGRDRVLVADGILSSVLRLEPTGAVVDVAGPPGAEVSGVALSAGEHFLAVAESDLVVPTTRGVLQVVGANGKRAVDLSVHEETTNPDSGIHYGVDHPTPCITAALAQVIGTPTSYDGPVANRPSSVAGGPGTSWFVSDSAANDVVKVVGSKVRTLAVLPRQRATITAAMAAQRGLPSCVIGVRYSFEAAPTDVELGPDGWLYVSTLGGSLDTLGLTAPGSIYRINPTTGRASRIVGGLTAPVNLAIDASRTVYVSGGGTIVKVPYTGSGTWGHPRPYLTLPMVAALEIGRGGLWAGRLVDFAAEDNTGSVVFIKDSRINS